MMKTMIKTAFVLLALLLPSVTAAHDFVVDGIFYNIINDNEVEVTYQESSWSYNADRYSGAMTIPSSVYYSGKTYPVTTIGKYAFRGCSGLTSINIPNSVVAIGNYAFNRCTQLSSIEMPNSVIDIGYYAFDNTAWYNNKPEGRPVYIGLVLYKYKGTMPDGTSITVQDGTLGIAGDAFEGCAGLTTINIPNSVTTISTYAFEGCSGLTTINNSNSIITIGAYAFYGCTSLTSIDFLNSVKTIDDYAFYECSGLTSVTIPSSVTSIGKYPFCLCTALASIQVANDNPKFDSRDNCNAIIETATNTLIAGCMSSVIPNSVTAIGDIAFAGCNGLASINIPNSVTSIGRLAFQNCKGLTSVTIPSSVATIGDNAFYGCIELTSLTIPNSVTAIGNKAFCRCTGLTSIIVDNDNPTYDSRDNCNALIETATNTLITGCNNTIIPNSVTSIGDNAFYYCSGLTSVTIPESVTAIGDNAFYYCSGLTSVTIPESVTAIGNYAFYYCTGLTRVNIPNSVTAIGDVAFAGCDGLNDVYCRIINPSEISMGYDVFFRRNGDYPTRTLHVKFNVWEYQNDSKWSQYFDKIVTYDYEVDGICYDINGSEAIVTNGDIPYNGELSIPPTVTIDGTAYTVTTIGSSAFEDCTGLTSVVIPNSVTTIEGYAFYRCSDLTSLTIPNSVTSIGGYAFDGTPWYNNQPDGLVYAGLVAYKYKGTMPEGTSITIREGTLGIAGYAFYGCSGLTSVVIPNSVTILGPESFRESGLTSVVIPGSVKTIGDKAFAECENLTDVTLSEGLTLIDEEAFSCTGITEIHLPESLVRIGEQAFEETPLTSITIPKNVAYLNNVDEDEIYGGVFDYCQQLLEVNVDPANATYASYNGMLLTKDMKTFLYYPGGRTGECVIPNTVTTIGGGWGVFDDCQGLTSLIIPSKVEYICGDGFYYCNALTLIRVLAVTPPSVGENYLSSNASSNITLEVPAESVEAYRAHEYWGQFLNIQAIELIPGDVDGDGRVGIGDVVNLIDYIIKGAEGEIYSSADVDGDGRITIGDITMIIDRIISGN